MPIRRSRSSISSVERASAAQALQPCVARRASLVDGPLVLGCREAEDRAPCLEHLLRQHATVRQVQDRMQVLDAVVAEHVRVHAEGGAHGERRGDHGRAGVLSLALRQMCIQDIERREEEDVELRATVVAIEQVIDVRNRDLGGEARVHGPAGRPFAVHLVRGVVGVDDVIAAHAERLQVAGEERRVQVLIEKPRDADAQGRTLLDERFPLPLRRGPGSLRDFVGHRSRRWAAGTRYGRRARAGWDWRA